MEYKQTIVLLKDLCRAGLHVELRVTPAKRAAGRAAATARCNRGASVISASVLCGWVPSFRVPTQELSD
jgi:hypothetical protein